MERRGDEDQRPGADHSAESRGNGTKAGQAEAGGGRGVQGSQREYSGYRYADSLPEAPTQRNESSGDTGEVASYDYAEHGQHRQGKPSESDESDGKDSSTQYKNEAGQTRYIHGADDTNHDSASGFENCESGAGLEARPGVGNALYSRQGGSNDRMPQSTQTDYASRMEYPGNGEYTGNREYTRQFVLSNQLNEAGYPNQPGHQDQADRSVQPRRQERQSADRQGIFYGAARAERQNSAAGTADTFNNTAGTSDAATSSFARVSTAPASTDVEDIIAQLQVVQGFVANHPLAHAEFLAIQQQILETCQTIVQFSLDQAEKQRIDGATLNRLLGTGTDANGSPEVSELMPLRADAARLSRENALLELQERKLRQLIDVQRRIQMLGGAGSAMQFDGLWRQ